MLTLADEFRLLARQSGIETPAIDRLAKEGLVFNHAYNCNPKCAPARACVSTG